MPNPEAIAAIERASGFPLPDDYKFFISNYSNFDGVIGNEHIELDKAERIIELNDAYKIFEQLSNVLLIGRNGTGESIAIIFDGLNKYRIILKPFIEIWNEYSVAIGDSFSDMFKQLSQGRMWFED